MDKEVFSGERYIPEFFWETDEISRFHNSRYDFAIQFVKGKKILDIASGEGFGSFKLAQSAELVFGVDKDEAAISRAKNKYQKTNLNFQIGGAVHLDFPDSYFDIVISFETFEHLNKNDQVSFLSEIRRILKRDGFLMISTPDKDIYGMGHNPFHLHELNKKELRRLLGRFFTLKNIYAQDPRKQRSVIAVLMRRSVDKIRHNSIWPLLQKLIPKRIRKKIDVSTSVYVIVSENSDIYTPRHIEEWESGQYLVVLCKK